MEIYLYGKEKCQQKEDFVHMRICSAVYLCSVYVASLLVFVGQLV